MGQRQAVAELITRVFNMKINQPTTEKLHNGAWLVSDIIGGQYVKRMYFAYTKKEAIANFKAELAWGKQP